jgi:hypothetical protein
VPDEAGAFEALGRELRQRLGPDLRAEAEEDERLAAQAARRRRRLVDVGRDLMARGDRVAVVLPGRRLTGVVVHAAGDLLTVRTAGGEVDVHLAGPVQLRVEDRAAGGGSATSDGPTSFKARLLELELAGQPVELGAAPAGEQIGTIRAVAVDHLVWQDRDGGEWFLPLATISHVLRRPPT